MKDFLIMAAKVIVAVSLIVGIILGASGTDTFQGQSTRIGNSQITSMKVIP